MTFLQKVEALRSFFGTAADLPLPAAIKEMNTQTDVVDQVYREL